MALRTRIAGGIFAATLTTAGLVVAAHADAATAPSGTATIEATTAQPSTDAAVAAIGAAARVPCDKHIAPNHAYRDGGFIYTTDGKGRPIGATGRARRADRPRTNCDTKVGNWGGPEYRGTRLIAGSLNGISRRYNLAPGTKEVDQQLMKTFEDAAKKCMDAGNMVIYTVAVGYKDRDVVPDSFALTMTIGVQQIHVRMNFKNLHYGHRSILAKKAKLSNDLLRARPGTSRRGRAWSRPVQTMSPAECPRTIR